MKVKEYIKNHIVLIVILAIIFVFPVSLSNQTKLSMRVIITGLAIDKENDDYVVTAQIVKPMPGNSSPGTSAEIDFVSDKGETIGIALSNLMYKTGKASAFSHTSFLIFGNELYQENIATCLDIFLRDKIMRSSTLVLCASGKASDEIKKTKQIPLSVGLGLQKIFSFKEEQSDALMVSVLEFLTNTNNYSKTAFASEISFEEDNNSEDEKTQKDTKSEPQTSLFKSKSPIFAFVDGKKTLEISSFDDICAYMILNQKSKNTNFVVEGFESERLVDAKGTINVKGKKIKKSLRFENQIPVLDINIDITNADIVEIISQNNLTKLNEEEYQELAKLIKNNLQEKIAKLFEKCKENKVDLYSAIELAYKYCYGDYMKYYFDNNDEFLNNLKINISINIKKLDF